MLQLALIVCNPEAFRIIQGHVKRHDVQLVDAEENIISCYASLRSQNQMKRTLSHSLGLCLQTNKQNLLPTASARLIYGDNECPVRVLVDSGSQETFLRTTIANDLKIKPYGSPATMTIKVLGGQEQRKKMSRVKFKLAPYNSELGS